MAEFKSIFNNAPITHVETNSFNDKVVRYITYSHDGSMMAAFGNGCRLWIFRGETEIYHEYLSATRKWDKVMTVEFSPDDKHLLVTGHNDPFFNPGNGRKSLIFKIGGTDYLEKTYSESCYRGARHCEIICSLGPTNAIHLVW